MPDGLLIAASPQNRSSELLVAAAANATVLTVEWAGPFPATGGRVWIDGHAYAYLPSSADENAAVQVLTLAAPGLLAAADAGTTVTLMNGDQLVTQREARIVVPGASEPITVVVPHRLMAFVPEGAEGDPDGPYVDPWPCTYSTEGFSQLVDVIGRVPQTDAGTLSGTIPDDVDVPPSPLKTDGAAPASSPVPVLRAFPGGISVSIPPVANADPVTRDLYISTNGAVPTGGAPTATVTGDGTAILALTSLGGADLSTAAGYFGRVIARDADGAAAPSAVAGPVSPGATGASATAAPTTVPAPAAATGSGSAAITWPAVADPFTRLRLYVANTNADGTVNAAAPKDATTLYGSDVKSPQFVSALTPGGAALDPAKNYQFALGSYNAVGDGPTSDWIVGTAGVITPLFIAQIAIINALSAATIQALNMAGGSISIANTPSGVENQEFAGTALPAGWSASTSATSDFGTVDVVTAGAPAGTNGSALRLSAVTGYAGGTPNQNLTFARSGFVAGDSLLEIRFKLTGAAITPNGGGTSDSIFGFGVRSTGAIGPYPAGLSVQVDPAGDNVVGPSWSFAGNIVYQTFAADTWYKAKLQVLAGAASAKIWKEADAEPAWVNAQSTAALASGASYVYLRRSGTGTMRSRQVCFDYVKTTAYATGFQVLQDGTGDWPAALNPLRAALTALGSRATDLETRATNLEAINAGGRLTSVENRATSLENRATSLEARATALEAINSSYVEATGANSYSPTSTANVATDLSLNFTVGATTQKWLITMATDVLINTSTAATTNIVEIVLDASGPATVVGTFNTAGPATTRVNPSKPFPVLTGLSVGVHQLTVRTRNAAASTSATVRTNNSTLTAQRVA